MREAKHELAIAGFESPSWHIACGGRPRREPEDHEPGTVRRGWQHEAASVVEERAKEAMFTGVSDKVKALVRSQGGPGAGAPFTWLAGLRVFCFRAPLSEDGSSCSVMSQQPGTSEVPLRRRMLSRAPWMSNQSCLHVDARRVPHHCSGKVEVAFACFRWTVRMWGAHGQQRTPPGLPALRTTPHEGSCTREDIGQDVQGGWGNCSRQRQTGRLERGCQGRRRALH